MYTVKVNKVSAKNLTKLPVGVFKKFLLLKEELQLKGKATPRDYESVTVLFTDFKGFTKIAEGLTPGELVEELNPKNKPVPKIILPEDLFESVVAPEVEPIPGMKTTLQVIVTDLVQEQRARLIYEYFAKETSGGMRDLFAEIAKQEIAHHRIFLSFC